MPAALRSVPIEGSEMRRDERPVPGTGLGLRLAAEKHLERVVPSYDAPPTQWYETPMIWCLLQPIRREATALIEKPEAR